MRRAAETNHLPSRADMDEAAGSREQLESNLLHLARSAPGNLRAMDTLLYAIDSQRLAEPGIRRVVFNPEDVDEVAQDVLIAVAEGVERFRGEGRFSSWLFGVGRNKALQFVRRKRAESPLQTDLGDSQRISSMIVANLDIRDYLTQLPEPYRNAVSLRDLDGQSYAEIARHLDLNLNTVRSHIARGRALLSSMVKKEVVERG